MSPKLWIGIFALFIVNAVISNIIDQQNLLTTAQMADINGASNFMLSESKNPTAGGLLGSGNISWENWGHILTTALTSDYSFFYDVDYTVATEAACTTAGGTWNSTLPACQIPNAFMILRYFFYWPITVATLLTVIIMFLTK